MVARLRILSRRSALARLQATLVARALKRRWPAIQMEMMTSASYGDRNPNVDLWNQNEVGVFTAELSRALVNDEADVAVHSWKDLPIGASAETMIAATLERADARDVLLVRHQAVTAKRSELGVLSSSPRRVAELRSSISKFIPWPIATVRPVPIRGNIPTRLAKLISGSSDALVIAKAALDRLLSDDAPGDIRSEIRAALAQCSWMVLPLQDFPTAPAQGALALEVASRRTDVAECVRAINHEPTWTAVEQERSILQGFGGGCHDAIGATVLVRDYGRIVSVRATLPGSADVRTWSLDSAASPPSKGSADAVWPRLDERHGARRRALDVTLPPGLDAVWIARAEAAPNQWFPDAGTVVWAAGGRTWEKLAQRGIWVHGCAEGLGDAEAPGIDALAGRALVWRRLTHNRSAAPDAVATYAVDVTLPADLASRTHFYWTSASQFLEAVSAFPSIRHGWHAAGPGRTLRVLRDTLDDHARISVWLDYEQWHRAVTF